MMRIGEKTVRSTLGGIVCLLLAAADVLAQTTPVKRIFFAGFADKSTPRREFVEETFKRKLKAAGFIRASAPARADAILSARIETRTTLMADDNQTLEIYRFELKDRRGRRVWQAERIIRDYQSVETAADELVKTLKNPKRRAAGNFAKRAL